MIAPIRTLYLKLFDEFQSHKFDDPDGIWVFHDDEIAYMEQIKSIDDLTNYVDDGTGRMSAMAYDCALAMGLSVWDAMSVANDH